MWLYWWKPLKVRLHLARFGGSWSSASAEATYLVYHVTLQDNVTDASCDFTSGRSSFYVTALPSLENIDFVFVDIHFNLWCDLARLRDQKVMWLYGCKWLSGYKHCGRGDMFLMVAGQDSKCLHTMLTHTKYDYKNILTKTCASVSTERSPILVTCVPSDKWWNICKKTWQYVRYKGKKETRVQEMLFRSLLFCNANAIRNSPEKELKVDLGRGKWLQENKRKKINWTIT